MNPEIDQIDEAREYLNPAWTEERAHDALARVKQGYARRRTARIAGGVAAIAAVCLAVPIVFGRMGPETLPHHQEVELSANTVEVSDGFRVVPLEPTATFSVAGVTDDSVRVDVSSGKSHFDISGSEKRTYYISAFGVEIEADDSSFDIEASDESITIHLHAGSLAVSVPGKGEAFILRGDESRTIKLNAEVAGYQEREPAKEPVEPVIADESPEHEDTPAPEEVAPSSAESEPKAQSADEPKPWRKLARKQDYKAASDLILDDPEVVDRKKVEELFDAADAMRRSGHPEQAASYLGMIATEHASDTRAGMAAHTRGRILSRRMSNHCDAADAFADARSLGLEGMLDRDALAHQTESLIKCGRTDEAAARLQDYRETYPSGPHIEKLEALLSR